MEENISKKAFKIYGNAGTFKGRIRLFRFCLWLKKKGIPIELYSMLEKKSGYIHAMALIQSEFLTVDFKERQVSFKYDEKQMVLYYDDPLFFRGICAISSNFLVTAMQFPDADIKDMVAFDMGATLGETAMLMVKEGAKKVYALEPYPFPYNLMLKNIDINGFKDKIIPLNLAVSGTATTLNLSSDFKDTIGASVTSGVGKTEIQSITLESMVKYANNLPFVIKCNVEGEEKDIFGNKAINERVLRNCRHARIAWHFKEYPKELIDKFPSYFDIEVLEARDISTGDHPYTLILKNRLKLMQ